MRFIIFSISWNAWQVLEIFPLVNGTVIVIFSMFGHYQLLQRMPFQCLNQNKHEFDWVQAALDLGQYLLFHINFPGLSFQFES